MLRKRLRSGFDDAVNDARVADALSIIRTGYPVLDFRDKIHDDDGGRGAYARDRGDEVVERASSPTREHDDVKATTTTMIPSSSTHSTHDHAASSCAGTTTDENAKIPQRCDDLHDDGSDSSTVSDDVDDCNYAERTEDVFDEGLSDGHDAAHDYDYVGECDFDCDKEFGRHLETHNVDDLAEDTADLDPSDDNDNDDNDEESKNNLKTDHLAYEIDDDVDDDVDELEVDDQEESVPCYEIDDDDDEEEDDDERSKREVERTEKTEYRKIATTKPALYDDDDKDDDDDDDSDDDDDDDEVVGVEFTDTESMDQSTKQADTADYHNNNKYVNGYENDDASSDQSENDRYDHFDDAGSSETSDVHDDREGRGEGRSDSYDDVDNILDDDERFNDAGDPTDQRGDIGTASNAYAIDDSDDDDETTSTVTEPAGCQLNVEEKGPGILEPTIERAEPLENDDVRRTGEGPLWDCVDARSTRDDVDDEGTDVAVATTNPRDEGATMNGTVDGHERERDNEEGDNGAVVSNPDDSYCEHRSNDGNLSQRSATVEISTTVAAANEHEQPEVRGVDPLKEPTDACESNACETNNVEPEIVDAEVESVEELAKCDDPGTLDGNRSINADARESVQDDNCDVDDHDEVHVAASAEVQPTTTKTPPNGHAHDADDDNKNNDDVVGLNNALCEDDDDKDDAHDAPSTMINTERVPDMSFETVDDDDDDDDDETAPTNPFAEQTRFVDDAAPKNDNGANASVLEHNVSYEEHGVYDVATVDERRVSSGSTITDISTTIHAPENNEGTDESILAPNATSLFPETTPIARTETNDVSETRDEDSRGNDPGAPSTTDSTAARTASTGDVAGTTSLDATERRDENSLDDPNVLRRAAPTSSEKRNVARRDDKSVRCEATTDHAEGRRDPNEESPSRNEVHEVEDDTSYEQPNNDDEDEDTIHDVEDDTDTDTDTDDGESRTASHHKRDAIFEAEIVDVDDDDDDGDEYDREIVDVDDSSAVADETDADETDDDDRSPKRRRVAMREDKEETSPFARLRRKSKKRRVRNTEGHGTSNAVPSPLAGLRRADRGARTPANGDDRPFDPSPQSSTSTGRWSRDGHDYILKRLDKEDSPAFRTRSHQYGSLYESPSCNVRDKRKRDD